MTVERDRQPAEPPRQATIGKVILIRHGAIEKALQGRYVGSSDVPLSAVGERQAATLAKTLARRWPAACFCSPLERARRTAELALPRMSATIEPELREIDFGQWERLAFEEIARRDPEAVGRWSRLEPSFRFPGGEAIGDFWKRAGRVAEAVGRASLRAGGPLVIVTHGGVIRALICHWLGFSASNCLLLEVGCASISIVRLNESGRGVLTLLNDRHHLEEAEG
jgi:broad specificity phosphatase PhoE